MDYNICLFEYHSGNCSLYQYLPYVLDVIRDSLEQTAPLKGKRQLSIIRREDGNNKQMFVVYNYVYDSSPDSFGLCFVFKDYYPQNINYFFSFCDDVVSDIVKEGQVLYISKEGSILAQEEEFDQYSPVLRRYLDRIKSSFNEDTAKLKPISSISSNYYSIYKNQNIVHELSVTLDDAWSITDSLNYNNVVIFTEEIEDVNIHQYKNVVRQLNEEKNELATELTLEKDRYVQLLKEKNRYKYVVALLFLLFISVLSMYFIFDALQKKKQQYAEKEQEMADSLVRKDSVITEKNASYKNLHSAYNALQGKYDEVERKLNEEQTKSAELYNQLEVLESKIRSHQPLVVTKTTYKKKSGELSVSYYGFNPGKRTITIKFQSKGQLTTCGNYSINIEKGVHTSVFQIENRDRYKYVERNKYILAIGDTIVGGKIKLIML